MKTMKVKEELWYISIDTGVDQNLTGKKRPIFTEPLFLLNYLSVSMSALETLGGRYRSALREMFQFLRRFSRKVPLAEPWRFVPGNKPKTISFHEPSLHRATAVLLLSFDTNLHLSPECSRSNTTLQLVLPGTPSHYTASTHCCLSSFHRPFVRRLWTAASDTGSASDLHERHCGSPSFDASSLLAVCTFALLNAL